MARHHYVGKAGHLAVMAELAWRGYNVATPEIDIGDDVFVVNSTSGAMRRMQVKTSSPRRQKTSTRFQFSIQEDSITTAMTPDLWFVFVLRMPGSVSHGARWRFCVVSRSVLHDWVRRHDLGSLSQKKRNIGLTLHDSGRLKGGGQDLTTNLDDWSAWPELAE